MTKRNLTAVKKPDRQLFGNLKKATPAVVAVTTKQVVRRLYPGGTDPIEDFLRRYYGLPRINQPGSRKKGFLPVSDRGHCYAPGHTITNAHVIPIPARENQSKR